MRISQISSLWSRWCFSKEGNRCFGTAPPKHHSQDFTGLFRLTVKSQHYRRWVIPLQISRSDSVSFICHVESKNKQLRHSHTNIQYHKANHNHSFFSYSLQSLKNDDAVPKKDVRGSWSSVTSKVKLYFFSTWQFVALSPQLLPKQLSLCH